MTAEDFAWYSQKVPACFIRWGTGNTEKGISSSVHTPEFEIDEDAMVYGIAALLQCVIQHQ
jgi:hippurate hydrolase